MNKDDMQRTLGLAGKRVLVTGADGFLGEFICKALRYEGVRVIGVDVREKLGITTNTGPYSIYKLDITDKEQFNQLVHIINGADGYLDGIVNNAAVSFKGNNLTSKEFMKTLEVNVEGTYNCINQLKSFLRQDSSIVNVASIYGLLSPDFKIYNDNEQLYSSGVYGMSKAAIIQMTRYYAVQLASTTRVNSISPGGILQGHEESFIKQYSERVPMKRMANPEEIANAILFLLSPMSSYINGHNLVVDGGLSAW